MLFTPWNRYDSDAWLWIIATEKADANYLEEGVKKAMNQYVLDLKSNNIWGDFGTHAVLMGARTLAGSLVDIKNPSLSWTNNNFVSGDYNRTTGLLGNASTKYLDSNYDNDLAGQNDCAMWVYAHTKSSTTSHNYGGFSDGTSAVRIRGGGGASDIRHNSRSTTNITDNGGNAVGLIGQTRSASTGYTARGNQADESETETSVASSTGDVFFFCSNDSGAASNYSSARLQAGCFGTAHSLSAAETCMDTYVTSIVALGL